MRSHKRDKNGESVSSRWAFVRFSYVAFNLISAIDSAKYSFHFKDIEAHIERRDLFDYLIKKIGDDMDLSLLDEKDKEDLLDEWQDLVFFTQRKSFPSTK
jgi:hypothetical protein